MGRIPLVNERTLNIEEIIAIHDKAKKSFSMFTGFKPGREIFGDFKVKKELPELLNIEGTNFSSFIIYGYINNKKTSLENFIRILEFGRKKLFKDLFYLACAFEERNSSQKKNKYDRMYVGFEDSVVNLRYSPGDSKVYWDNEYRKNFFEQIINVAILPILIYEKDKEFFLEHTKGHNIRSVQANYTGGNPYDFICEIKNSTNEELISKMELIVSNVSSEKPITYYWYTSTSREDTSKQVYDFYELIRNANLYADKYDINYTCSIQEINGLETMRAFIDKKGEILMSLCSFLMSPPMIPEDEQD